MTLLCKQKKRKEISAKQRETKNGDLYCVQCESGENNQSHEKKEVTAALWEKSLSFSLSAFARSRSAYHQKGEEERGGEREGEA